MEPIKQAATSVIQKMEDAREVLGDFCKVVTRKSSSGEVSKGVVLLKSVPREIRRKIYKQVGRYGHGMPWEPPNDKDSSLFLYTEIDDARDVFFVSPTTGIAKAVNVVARIWDVPDGTYDRERWLEHNLVNDIQKPFVRSGLPSVGQAWHALLKDDTGLDKEGEARQSYGQLRSWITGEIGGQQIGDHDESRSLIGSLSPIGFLGAREAGQIKQVFEDSVTAAHEAKVDWSSNYTGLHGFAPVKP